MAEQIMRGGQSQPNMMGLPQQKKKVWKAVQPKTSAQTGQVSQPTTSK